MLSTAWQKSFAKSGDILYVLEDLSGARFGQLYSLPFLRADSVMLPRTGNEDYLFTPPLFGSWQDLTAVLLHGCLS